MIEECTFSVEYKQIAIEHGNELLGSLVSVAIIEESLGKLRREV